MVVDMVEFKCVHSEGQQLDDGRRVEFCFYMAREFRDIGSEDHI